MISHSVVKKTEANSVQNDWKYIIILCKKTGKNIEELGKPSCSWFISILLRFNRQKYANIDMLYLLYRMFVHVNGWKCANMRRCYQQKVRKWFFKIHTQHIYMLLIIINYHRMTWEIRWAQCSTHSHIQIHIFAMIKFILQMDFWWEDI